MNTAEALIAAYRQGLGLAAVTIVTAAHGARLICAAEELALEPGESVHARWWCRSAQQAEWLVGAVVRAAKADDADAPSHLCRAVIKTAKRLGISLRADAEISAEAAGVIARLEQEIAAQQRAGTLKSINRGYRDYRLAASARGEKMLRYADWMARYKAKLIRDIAHNLRSL